ncbi:MAG: DNA replication/repair protein RecF [Caldilineaceae bacterium]|nr:DNA replication/repair protein RecF [Caldilineaceae bacterium]
MLLTHLSLTHFRNYAALELDLPSGMTLLQGENAQGKTNLLEAVYFLATSRSVHAQQEREVVDWGADAEPIPYSRVAGTIHAGMDVQRPLELEILLTPRGDGVNFKKQVRINGVNKRAMDLVGQLRAVLFLPEDIVLVTGSPGERRRYLDIALCQIDRTYCRTLSAYQKIVTQRNSLLKQLREEGAAPQASSTSARLDFWDEKLIGHGSAVIARRHNFITELCVVAARRQQELSDSREALLLQYAPSFNPGSMAERVYGRIKEGEFVAADEIAPTLEAVQVAALYQAHLRRRRERELAAGNTLYGPHRDDMRLFANERDLRAFGSRGQQRTAALALKLAEMQVMTKATGSAPVLLLDDVMSELDARRRATLLQALNHAEQVILTTTDWEDFTPEFRRQAQCFTVLRGSVTPVNNG